MPPQDVNRLIEWALIYPRFQEKLLNPTTRFDALNQFNSPDKNDPMFGVRVEIENIKQDIKAGKLTPIEMNTLLNIKAENLEEFSRRCVETGLVNPEGGRPTESSR